MYVQQIAGAIRASVDRSTGYTPNRLMLEREVNTPAQLMFTNVQQKSEYTDDYVRDNPENIDRDHSVARDTLKNTLKRMKRNYVIKVLLRPYAIDDIVYLLDKAIKKGKCRKLCSPWARFNF
ncbi:hypothetical protein DPMN_044255 [Dreissena polymorpha]|uniref:Uncharacterized protein n=1 Tax=Dreissena polymorpha TaxID=45954 RepID=A0A9D4HYR5_DREPO|nr:hypothetical protein DPMN_044255 [Dreissena polymorpha]